MDMFTHDEVQDVEYFTMNIQRLMKERMKITQRGKLNEREDLRLDEIDAEVIYWDERIESIYLKYEDDEWEDCDSSVTTA